MINVASKLFVSAMLLYLKQRDLETENSVSAAKPHRESDFWDTGTVQGSW